MPHYSGGSKGGMKVGGFKDPYMLYNMGAYSIPHLPSSHLLSPLRIIETPEKGLPIFGIPITFPPIDSPCFLLLDSPSPLSGESYPYILARGHDRENQSLSNH